MLEVHVVECIAEVLGLAILCGIMVLVVVLLGTGTVLATLGTRTTLTALGTGTTLATLGTLTACGTLLITRGFLNEHTV